LKVTFCIIFFWGSAVCSPSCGGVLSIK
jgi:hypothetical protein